MSKVFSFRLSDDNSREAQAREVIQAWVGEGYSLRHVIVEALLSYKKVKEGHGELNFIVKQLEDLILSLDKQPLIRSSEASLSNSFLDAMKQSAKGGMRAG
jgi:hypothetical protein